MEYSLAINSSRYTAGLTVSNPKIASGSYFLRVNKIIHDGGIYKTTLLSLTIITTPELCRHYPLTKLSWTRIPIISSSEAKTIFKEMISEDMFCFRHFGRVTDLIYNNRHKYRLWLLDNGFLIQIEQMRTVCVVTKHSWLGNRLLYCGSNTRHSFQSSTFCFPHLDKLLLPLESEK